MLKESHEISLPYKFQPRPYQLPFLKEMDKGARRAVLVWHRRSGKDVASLNMLIGKMWDRVGAYYYFFPEFAQGRRVIWEGIQKDGTKFLDHFPEDLIRRKNETEMKIELKNGSIFQVIGTDKFDKKVIGTNVIGCIFSEFPLQDPDAWNYIRPILRENDGWAVFCYTPRGRMNHGYDLYEMAKRNGLNRVEIPLKERWFSQILTIKDTEVLTAEDIEAERREGTPEEIIQQEYFCSFSSQNVGTYYKIDEKHITNVAYEQDIPVDTYWDLGVGDSTAIWFIQQTGVEYRAIDYLENSGEGLLFYIKELQSKGYIYGSHFAPHDIQVRELSTGLTRKDVARNLGINFRITKNIPVEDGVNNVRMILPKVWFDEKKCRRGIDCLTNYKKEWDEKNNCFKSYPKHDWTCFSGDTKILTNNGMYPIMEMRGDKILTKNGWRNYLPAKITGENVPLVEVLFVDGTRVKCTPEHLFLTAKGWKFAETLEKGFKIQSSLTLLRSISMVVSTVFGLTKDILQRVAKNFIEMLGGMLTGLSRIIAIFTTKTGTQKIILSPTLNVFPHTNIYQRLGTIQKQVGSNFLSLQERRRQSGILRKKEDCGINDTQKELRLGPSGREKSSLVLCVKKSFHALSAGMDMLKNSVLQIVRPLTIVGVKKVKETNDVWDICVPSNHQFSLSNGAIVHNSHGSDAFRYFAVNAVGKERSDRNYDLVRGRNFYDRNLKIWRGN